MERKVERENQSYNPFGRGGGGAPIKDKEGNIKADLSKIRLDNNDLSNAPLEIQREVKIQQLQLDRSSQQNNSNNNNNNFISNAFPPNTNLDTSRSKKGEDGQSFARGGNGIFGEGKVRRKIFFLHKR